MAIQGARLAQPQQASDYHSAALSFPARGRIGRSAGHAALQAWAVRSAAWIMNFFDTCRVFVIVDEIQSIMTKKLLILFAGAAMAAGLFTAQSAEKKAAKVDTSKLPPAATKQGVTYATDIKPIFDKSCIKCHGAEKQKGKLRLDSLEAALKGGEAAKVIEPGKSADSILVHNVAHLGDEDDFMPPPDNKDKIPPLTKEQIGLIRAWIDQGAK